MNTLVDPAAAPVPLSARARHRLWRSVRAAARAAGVDMVRRHQYSSPIPDPASLPARLWSDPSPMEGVAFDLEAQFALLEGELLPMLDEAAAELEAGVLGGLLDDNHTYRSVDLEVLYARVRHQAPARVVELGSGVSTLVIDAALRRNREENGWAGEHRVFDPFRWCTRLDGGAVPVVPLSVTEVPRDEFAALGDGDLLFVDTSHVVRAGGDVNHIFLEALPCVGAGAVVQIHDIYLPWEYPREFYERFEYYWAEQYLLQAFLAFNASFETLLAHHALTRADPARLGAVVPSYRDVENPTAYWLRRRR